MPWDFPHYGTDGSRRRREPALCREPDLHPFEQGTAPFHGWPRHHSLTHEGTYWKGIERAWRGGLRILVADPVENRALGEIYWLKRTSAATWTACACRRTTLCAAGLHPRAVQGPGPRLLQYRQEPAGGRAVIADGKLAVVIGVETSQPFDCLYRDGVEFCSEAQIESGLEELWNLGVRSMFRSTSSTTRSAARRWTEEPPACSSTSATST